MASGLNLIRAQKILTSKWVTAKQLSLTIEISLRQAYRLIDILSGEFPVIERNRKPGLQEFTIKT